MKKRPKLTEEEKKEAERLKKIWDRRKKEWREQGIALTQEDAASELGFNTQGAVSQYLNGKIKLNVDAIIRFSKLLDCKPSDIRPSLDISVGRIDKKKLTQHNNHEISTIHVEPTANDEVENFSRNLCILMQYHKDTPLTLSERCGIDPEIISDMMTPQSNDIPNLVNVGLIAKAYGLQTWHLIYPNAPIEILINSSIEKFVENYAHATKETREAWARIAEESTRYRKVNNE